MEDFPFNNNSNGALITPTALAIPRPGYADHFPGSGFWLFFGGSQDLGDHKNRDANSYANGGDQCKERDHANFGMK